MTKIFHNVLSCSIAIIWIINGLFCKVLNAVPRHQQIVGQILGTEHSRLLTIIIGCAEIGMAIWIFSKIKSQLNAIMQMAIVGVMNILEFVLVPDLLLWGKFNIVFAFLFILVVYLNEFYLNKKLAQQS